MIGQRNTRWYSSVVYLCLLFLLLPSCVPGTAPEPGENPDSAPGNWTAGIYHSDCLGRNIEIPGNAPALEVSYSETPIETQLADSNLVVLGTVIEISHTCFNQDGGAFYRDALPYFEVRLAVDEILHQSLELEAAELVLTQVGYSPLDDSISSPFAVNDQVVALVVDRELAWQGGTMRPILRPFDHFASSLLLTQPDGAFASGDGQTSLTLEALRAQLTGEAAPAEQVSGCTEDGPGVFTPEDVRCYLDSFSPEFVREIDEETAVLFTDPNAISNWVGGALVYHIPTVSSLVLDVHGDVDPSVSYINNRAALVAYSQLAANPQLMAELKQTVQELWQTSDSGQPEVRLGVAWQDGANTVFLAAIAGLPADDERFYCPSETWKIDDEEISLISECIARNEETMVSHLFFAVQEIGSREPVQVQLTLEDVASNFLRVNRGDVTLETAVYQAAISYKNGRSAVIHQMTTTELYNPGGLLTDAIDQNLLQTFISANQTELNLSYLFLNSNTYFLQPRAVIERDYLPPTGSTPNCDRFREEYAGLGGGVITLSQIGISADGQQAVLFMQRACSEAAVTSSYLVLNRRGEGWQVVDEYGRVEIESSTPLMPELVYNGHSQGCGDIFLYKANSQNAMSEYIVVGIDARAFSLSADPLTLELVEHPESIVARLDLFGDRVYNFGEFPYCNDVGPAAQPQAVWQAESGTLTVRIDGEVPEESCMGEGYQATVHLENVLFRNGEETVQLDEILFEDVPVGWCAG
ncbi:MAG: hypothetical protein CL608_27320 [Anaerolineaceae bacterium]|nr:hypothetical protein [Anaerolineaceae bacterium]